MRRCFDLSDIDYPVRPELAPRRQVVRSRYTKPKYCPSIGRLAAIDVALGSVVVYEPSMGKWQPFKKLAKAMTTNIQNMKQDIREAATKVAKAAATNIKNLSVDVKRAGDKVAAAATSNVQNLSKDLAKVDDMARANIKVMSDDIKRAGDKISDAAKVNLETLKKDASKAADKLHAWGEKTGINDLVENVVLKIADTYTGGLASGVKASIAAGKADAAAAAAAAAAPAAAQSAAELVQQPKSKTGTYLMVAAAAIPVILLI